MRIKGKRILVFIVIIITFFTVTSNFSLVLATQQNNKIIVVAAKKGKKPQTTESTSNPIDNPDDYKPGDVDGTDIEPLTNKGAIILNTLTTIGIILSVIVLVILGIKYMIGSVEEKAEYKKTMIPYLVGVFMLATITIILRLVAGMVANLSSTI